MASKGDYNNSDDLEKIVDAVDMLPEFFVRTDGTRMAVMSADFYDMVKEVYTEHTVKELHPGHEIYDQPASKD